MFVQYRKWWFRWVDLKPTMTPATLGFPKGITIVPHDSWSADFKAEKDFDEEAARISSELRAEKGVRA